MAQSNMGYFTFVGGRKVAFDFTGIPVITGAIVDDIASREGYSRFDIECVYLPGSIIVIDDHAFNGAKNLVKVEFEKFAKLNSIGYAAFGGCESLEEFDFPEALNYICNSAFHSTSLKKLRLPRNLFSLGASAFHNCRKLELVDMRDSRVIVIPPSCFELCTSLLKVFFLNYHKFTVCQEAFADCDDLSVVENLSNEAFIHPSNTSLLNAKRR